MSTTNLHPETASDPFEPEVGAQPENPPSAGLPAEPSPPEVTTPALSSVDAPHSMAETGTIQSSSADLPGGALPLTGESETGTPAESINLSELERITIQKRNRRYVQIDAVGVALGNASSPFLPVFLTSYQSVLEKYFKNDTVLRTMAYEALYFGLPPCIVPGPYAMVPYTEHVGIYYPKGGMIQIPLALQRLGEQMGMQVHLNSHVTKVLIENGKAIGVRLADGSEITCDKVVSNINAKTLYLKLIGEEYLAPMVVRGLKSYAYSISVPMVYVALDYEPPLEAHHSIIAISPEELNKHYFEFLKAGVLAKKNFGLICWSTHTDPSLAPDGHHLLNLIPEGGYYLRDTDWDAEKPHFIERTIDNLSKTAIPGLKEHVVFSDCATPLDFERHLMLPEGAIYCLQQDLAAQAVFRPSARSKSIDGLYLVGSSTHPGGGVPTTIASGWIASKLIAQDD